MRNVVSFELVLPCTCLTSCLQSLFLVSRSLIILCLGINFCGFIICRFTELLESVGLHLLPNLRSCQRLFLGILFQAHAFSSPSPICLLNCWQIPKSLSIFLQSVQIGQIIFTCPQVHWFYPLSTLVYHWIPPVCCLCLSVWVFSNYISQLYPFHLVLFFF